MALGVAVLSTLAASRTGALLAGGASQAAALTGGYRLAFGTGAVLVATAAAVATVAGLGSVAHRPKADIPVR